MENEQAKLMTASLLVLAAVSVAVALIYTKVIMVPFVLAIFITYMVAPLVDMLQLRLKIPRPLAVVFAVIFVLAIVYVVGLLLVISAAGLVDKQALYQERLASLVGDAVLILERFNIDVGQAEVMDELQQQARDLPVMAWLRTLAGRAINLISHGFMVMIFVVFLLMGRNPKSPAQVGIYAQIDKKIRGYLVTKVLLSAITGISVGVILWLLGLDLALAFGVLAFLLNFIPSLGSIIATLLPLPVALIQYDSLWLVLLVLVLPGAVQMTIGNFVEPMLMGDSLELHPITILLALVFWGLLWGPVGMLLAAPITAVLRIVLGRIETTRPIAELLSGRLPPSPDEAQPGPEQSG